MGLDWCIVTVEDSKKSKCEVVGAKKIKDFFTREEYIKEFKDTYKAEYLEKVRTDDKEWTKTQKKYFCDKCMGMTENICAKCPTGGFACAPFGFGGCNFRGKITGYALEAAGNYSSIAYADCKTQEDWENLIGTIKTAIEDVTNSKKTKFGDNNDSWNKKELLQHLQQAKTWLEFWYEYVKAGEPIELYAWS